MKLIVRIFAMLVVFAGLTAASISSTPAPSSSQFGSAVSGAGPMMPLPPCPTCNGGGNGGPGGLRAR